MRMNFGTRARDLTVAIGPSIGPCCYEVGPDVLDAFRRVGFSEAEIGRWFRRAARGERLTLDVAKAVIDQLHSGGVPVGGIDACSLCTACHPALFHSYRRDGAGTGRMAAVIRAGKVASSE
jgi:copper oxidase (laccase) domain-containing protein